MLKSREVSTSNTILVSCLFYTHAYKIGTLFVHFGFHHNFRSTISAKYDGFQRDTVLMFLFGVAYIRLGGAAAWIAVISIKISPKAVHHSNQCNGLDRLNACVTGHC